MTMKFEDFANSVKAQLYDRAVSPLLASFALAWVLINYRFIAIVFSDREPTTKFLLIDNYVFPDWQAVLLRGVAYPLLASVFFIFVYPYPARYVFRFYRQRQLELKQELLRIEGETPLSEEEARSLRAKALAQQLEFDNVIQARDQEILQLRGLIRQVETAQRTRISSLLESPEPPSEPRGTPAAPLTRAPAEIWASLNDIERGVLMTLSMQQGLAEQDIKGIRDADERLATKAAVDSLREQELISKAVVRSMTGVDLTALGRKVLLQRGKGAA
ncbi:hypothetical protein BWI17_11010 [Betaproteobacteria bacterium GR16-43]|nr:hypothetical protein BWI17_11010 [Betaproteobacteria bacterium GR16-43]